MPWGIRKTKDGGSEVYKKTTGKTIKGGKHPDHASALKHLQAIEINYYGKKKGGKR
jgi:hypothetical protein